MGVPAYFLARCEQCLTRISRSLPIALVLVVVAPLLLDAPATGTPTTKFGFDRVWSHWIPGLNLSSSPVIADIDSDGRNEIVFGHRDGFVRAYEADGTLKWRALAVPAVDPEMCTPQKSASAIDSSPAVADIDDDGVFEVVVGVGSANLSARDQNGSVIAFDGRTGRIEWSFVHSRDTGNIWDGQSRELDGWCEATYATPAIADVDGDGSADVVFGSYDFFIWAVDGSGSPLPGFPINNDDTIWSSPALFDVDNDGDAEIFIGGDSTPAGYVDHLGGLFRAVDYQNGEPVTMWLRQTGEVIHSSPAIADINGDGRFEAVVGSGDNWHIHCRRLFNPICGPLDGNDNTKVWAFHLDDGTTVQGWPVSASGTVWSSPAIGDIDDDGDLEVVVGSDDAYVYAFNGDGTRKWRVVPDFAHISGGLIRGAPIIADLDGDGDQDVAIGTARGLALLDGRSGESLEENIDWRTGRKMSFSMSHETAPAVGTLNGQRSIVFVANSPDLNSTTISRYLLPATSARDAWPMFRHGSDRIGTASISRSDHQALAGNPNFVRSSYFTRPMQWMVGTQIIDPGSAACLAPHSPASRGETALYLWRGENSPQGSEHPFFDVTSRDEELNQAVAWMHSRGITTGKTTSSGSFFAANDRLTRAEVAAFLYRHAGTPEVGDHPFVDVHSAWQQEPVAWLSQSGITTGTSPTTFSPDTQVTRGQLAAFLYRYNGGPEVRFNPVSPDCSPAVARPNLLELSSGFGNTCFLDSEGNIYCDGNNSSGQSDAPAGRFKAVSTGSYHSCSIGLDDAVVCWGSNGNGQSDAPVGRFKAVSAGYGYSCAVGFDDAVACWGSNWNGQSDAPVGRFKAVSAGRGHSCAIGLDEAVVCWGGNRNGQSDAPAGRFKAVSAGSSHSCALRFDDAIVCWGWNGWNNDGLTDAPVGRFKAVSAGSRHSCAVGFDDAVVCWGSNWNGQSDAPVGRFKAVSAGDGHSCGIRTNNIVACW